MARFIIAVGISAALLAAVAPVAAEEKVITGLQECRQIVEAQQRLACYDALAEEFHRDTSETAEEAGSEAARPASRDQSVAAEPAVPEGAKSPEKTESPARQAGPPAPESEAAPDKPEAGRTASDGSRPERVTSAEDLSLPHRTRIDSFASNRRGDYRFRIGEGIVFERAGGPGVPTEDLTGAAVTLSKNFLGQWRAEVEGRPRELWVSPVRR
jgi:hypothetical protein